MQNTVTAQITPLAPRQNSANAPVALCRYGGGRFELSETGVYFLGKDKDGNEQSPSMGLCTFTRNCQDKGREERGMGAIAGMAG